MVSVLGRLQNWVNEKNCFRLLLVLFLLSSFLLALVPYDPSTDLADATTNDIWVEYYDDGIFHIPFDEWDYQQTQSVVVEHDGQYVVVNEKGPGHVMMLLPFHLAGVDFLFAVLMVFFAVFSTYMLGKRLVNWRVGFCAAILVLTNITVIVMWHRFYWTDASTMHTLVLSVWLLVEASYWYNGRSLDPRKVGESTRKHMLTGIGFGILSGLAFGASVSTRYATGLIVLAMLLYLFIFYLLRCWPALKERRILDAVKGSTGMWLMIGAFLLGLMCILIPLMQYNSEYFGGPLGSGYDAPLLKDFDPAVGVYDRNTSASWSSSLTSSIYYASTNFIKLLPAFITRMPLLLLAPLGIWFLRRKLDLVLLLPWIGINLFTYLSLSWVAMYANITNIFWEPRYFMPALPPLALLAGVAIDRLSLWRKESLKKKGASPDKARVGAIVVTGVIVGVLVLCGVGCAVLYFTSPVNAGHHGPPGPGQVQLVTTDQLILRPDDYLGNPVRVNDAIVMDVLNNMVIIRSQGANQPEGIRVRFIEWPPGELPAFSVGQTVEVQGMFMRASPPGQPPVYVLNVKYQTRDFIKPIP